jgi:hypothetical protein
VHDILSILPSLFVKIFFPEPAWQVAGCFLKTAFLLKSQMVSSLRQLEYYFSGCTKFCVARDLSTEGIETQKHCEASF